jgi:predicted AAA+ superfamily ATPase
MIVERILKLSELLDKKSHFLLGPRGTGKTALASSSLNGAVWIHLLIDDVYSRLLRRPSALQEMIPSGTSIVVIDEIQKLPKLLDEVHSLIESRKIRFLMTGSSARKLRSAGVNLLGGRAWLSGLYPLTWRELGSEFELVRYLNHGGLPSVYFSDHPRDELRAYAQLYVREEIQAEALVRRLDHFVRFLDVAGLGNGEILNFEKISNDSGVPSRTVEGYFRLLEDTLLGFSLDPFQGTRRRKAIKKSKFFFFDVGVAGALAKRGHVDEGSELFGRTFEHFLIQEVRAFLSYRKIDLPLNFWRSQRQDEVDLLIGTECAVEFKSSERCSERDTRGLLALKEEKKVRHFYLVSTDPLQRESNGVHFFPWDEFLKRLWSGQIVS